MHETWYIMENGSVADPSEVAPDENGVLRHNDGRYVAYAAHGPRSRSVDAEAERAKAEAAMAEAAKVEQASRAKADEDTKATVNKMPDQDKPAFHRTRDMKPEGSSPTYKTR